MTRLSPDKVSWRERLRRELLLQVARVANHREFAVPALEVTWHDIRIPSLPPDLEGVMIAQVSDLHVGPGPWRPLRWREAAAAVERAQPDIIVNTGDFLQWEPPPSRARSVFERFLAGGGDLEEPPHTFAILGNHDYHAGHESVRELRCELEDEGVRVLTNQTVGVSIHGTGISITGLTTHSHGFDGAISGLLQAPRPRIVLIHEPDVAACIPARAADLVLAGHTHGGQITVPGLRPFIVRRFSGSRYVEGWYRVNDIPMYVNRGLGCTGYPLRFRARPEVSFFRLTH